LKGWRFEGSGLNGVIERGNRHRGGGACEQLFMKGRMGLLRQKAVSKTRQIQQPKRGKVMKRRF